MKILITGASGLLGRAISSSFADQAPTTCAWSRAKPSDLKLDLLDSHAIQNTIRQQQPNLIIHTAAERKPDICENQQDLTRTLNVESTRILAEEAAKIGAKLLYISTDYVFDGENPPYAVDTPCNPLNFYGKTKREGETVVLAASNQHIILRVPILYGSVEQIDESPVTLLLNELKNQEPHWVDHWAVRYPTYVKDIADTLRAWYNGTLMQGNGIYHFSGGEPLTKYEMVCTIADTFELDHSHLSPDLHPPKGAPRPQNSQLALDRLQKEVPLQQTAFHQVILEILTPFVRTEEENS